MYIYRERDICIQIVISAGLKELDVDVATFCETPEQVGQLLQHAI